MINRQEVFNLIRDRIWIYQSVMNSDPNPILLTLTGSDEETTKSFFSLYLGSSLMNLPIGILTKPLRKLFLLTVMTNLSSGQASRKSYHMAG